MGTLQLCFPLVSTPPLPTVLKGGQDTPMYRQLLIKEPLLDPYLLRRLRPIFSFQGTEMLTHKGHNQLLYSHEDLHSHIREEVKKQEQPDSLETVVS